MRSKIEAILILKITLPIQPSFLPTTRVLFNAASSESYKCLKLCLEDVVLVFHKLLYLVWYYVVVENNLETHRQVCAASVHLGWDGNWNNHHICAVTLTFFKQSSDNSSSRAVVTFEVAPHQDRICPPGMKVVTYNGFTAYYWVGSLWRLSKYRVKRWTWCHSTNT